MNPKAQSCCYLEQEITYLHQFMLVFPETKFNQIPGIKTCLYQDQAISL